MATKKITRAAKRATRSEKKVAEVAAEHRNAPAVRLLSMLSDAGDQPQLRSLSGALIAGGLLSRRPRLARAGVRMLVAHEAATAIKNFIKNRVDRARPRSARSARDSEVRKGSDTSKEQTSFPSGHTAGATAVAQAFAREFPEHAAPARAAAALIGLAQVPRCAHYPSDVGVGAVIGVAAEAIVGKLWPAPPGDDPHELRPEVRPPLPLPASGYAPAE
jgi:membrane-associated phospholipid phosphatase